MHTHSPKFQQPLFTLSWLAGSLWLAGVPNSFYKWDFRILKSLQLFLQTRYDSWWPATSINAVETEKSAKNYCVVTITANTCSNHKGFFFTFAAKCFQNGCCKSLTWTGWTCGSRCSCACTCGGFWQCLRPCWRSSSEPAARSRCIACSNSTRQNAESIDWIKVLRPTWHKIGHFGDVLPANLLT